jgi:regulator of RNase E activity RraA
MAASYQAFGAVGLITSGAARDLDQVRRLGFPAFAGGAICSHGYSHLTSIHQPVRVGGIAIRPGDLLHADANGVTTIPAEIASEVASVAADYVVCEAIVLDHLKSGARDVASYSEARRACLDAIAELGKRVRRRAARA